MKNYISYLLLVSLLPTAGLRQAPVGAPDITGSWRMSSHRVDPARNGIADIYEHFKSLYGGCREDMGMTFNADGSVKVIPIKGCQNPLGAMMMKVVMASASATTWQATDQKIILKDRKGNQQEYDIQVNGSIMTWGFDTKDKEGVVRHTVEFRKE